MVTHALYTPGAQDFLFVVLIFVIPEGNLLLWSHPGTRIFANVEPRGESGPGFSR